MADQRQTQQEQPRSQQRGSEIEFTTLVITAVASAVAAFITSKVWAAGTLASAAFTPVVIAVVKEALRKPADVVVAGKRVEDGRFHHHWRRAALTGLAGFAIFAVIITISELAAGSSVTDDERGTTLFGGTRTVVVKERTVTVETVTNNVTTVTPAPSQTTSTTVTQPAAPASGSPA
jgi:hypothetical protein